MKRITVFILLIGLTSCEYFNAKKTTSEAILEEELKTFNWNQVDTFPTFTICDSFQTKLEKEQCFQTTITNHISKNLQDEIIVVNQDVSDIVMMELLISEKGDIKIINLEAKDLTFDEIPNLERLLSDSLLDLPKLFPAIKRGQQVKTQFKLPIVLEVN